MEARGPGNAARILSALWHRPGLSRQDLAGMLQLDKSTLSRTASRLLDAGLIRETLPGFSGPQGGRRPVGLDLRGDWGVWLGLEVNPDGGRAVLTDLSGVVRDEFVIRSRIGPADITPFLSRALDEGRNRAQGIQTPLRGVGLGVPGVVDPRTGKLARSRPLGITTPRDVAGDLAAETGLAVTVDNDADCCCRGELTLRGGESPENFILIWGEPRRRGLSVGFGTVLGGEIHRGDHGAGGEFLSVYVTRGRDQFALDPEVLSRAPREGDALNRVVGELAPQVAMAANLLDIDLVILGGLFKSRFGDVVKDFETTLKKRRTYPGLARPQVRAAARDQDAVAYGAAIRFVDHFDRIVAMNRKE